MIGQLGVKKLLKIMPEGGALQARLDKLVEVYFKNHEYNAKLAAGLVDDDGFRPDAEQYFSQTRQILDFFADDDAKNDLAENDKEQRIKKILSDPTLSNSSDFAIFLHSVVKADLEKEEEVEGEGEQARKQRIAKEKYGDIGNINKFSISHIEWLADEMPGLIDL